MMSPDHQVTVLIETERIVTLDVEGVRTQVAVELEPSVLVVTTGYQGPIGTVDDGVLGEIMQAANDARLLAEQNQADLTYLTQKLRAAFVFQTGAISAQ
ncbi:TPA: hypothetical protein ACMDRM_001686 [Vibrio cholerae]